MFALSLTTSYAFKALACLVDGSCSTRQIADIARCTHVPRPYLAKVMVLLVQAGLVASKRGYRGGISLAKPANEISLLDVVIAVEGEPWASDCLLGLEKCPEAQSCPTSALWTRIRGELQAELGRLTLAEFVRSRSACAGSASGCNARENAQDSLEDPPAFQPCRTRSL
jgi:Rrf2 family transcriptional regulator, iron-sulfur cluster assembly transcription factor